MSECKACLGNGYVSYITCTGAYREKKCEVCGGTGERQKKKEHP